MTRTDPLLQPDEAELRDLLERTMSGTTAPTGIGPHALRHGRRLRARRRVGIAAGAVAASAAAVLTLPVALGGGSATVVDPADEPSSSATAPTPEPSPPGERPDGWWDMPATQMVAAVEAILPDGVTVASPGPLTLETPEGGEPASGWIAPELNGATGPGLLNVVLWPDFAAGEGESSGLGESPATGEPSPATEYSGPDGWIDCPGNLNRPSQCFEILDKAGRHVGRRSITQHKGLLTFEVILRRDDGAVYAAAFNSVDDKPGPRSTTSANQPPLTLDQLEDLVRNDTWVMPAS